MCDSPLLIYSSSDSTSCSGGGCVQASGRQHCEVVMATSRITRGGRISPSHHVRTAVHSEQDACSAAVDEELGRSRRKQCHGI